MSLVSQCVIRTAALLAFTVAASFPGTVRADEMDGYKSAIVRLGDVDGDHICDFAVASRDRCRMHLGPSEKGAASNSLPDHPGKGPAECVWILSGKDAHLIRTLHGDKAGDGFGNSLANAGDIDHDGVPDLIVGASSPIWTGWGDITSYVRVYSGKDGHVLFEFRGKNPPKHVESTSAPVELAEAFGQCVAGGVDLNGDGYPEILISAPVEMSGTLRMPHSLTRIYSGKDGSLLLGIDGCGNFGRSLCAIRGGGVDGSLVVAGLGASKSILDELKGSTKTQEQARAQEVMQVHLLSAKDGHLMAGLAPDGAADKHDAVVGWSLVSGEDVDGDGIADVLCGNLSWSVDLLSGKDLHKILSIPGPVAGAYLDAFGTSLDFAGDMDGDGVTDIVVGANEAQEIASAFDEGYARVYSGKSGHMLMSLFESRTEGADVCALGDVNGDGVPDFALSLVHRDHPGRFTQRVLIISGKDVPKWHQEAVLFEVDLMRLREAESAGPIPKGK